MIDRLCHACGIALPVGEERERADVLLRKARECRQAANAAYRAELLAIFGGVVDVPHVYHQLAKLPFRSFVTTNFDPSLRTALQHAGTCDGVYVYPMLPYAMSKVRLFHIHGLIATDIEMNTDHIVLGDDDFARAYSETAATLRSFLHQLLNFNACVFVGVGLREPELGELFRACVVVRASFARDYPTVPLPKHFPLQPMLYETSADSASIAGRALEAEKAEDSRFKDLGVTVVRYDPLDLRYRGLIRVLEEGLSLPMP